jgi:hypothetical protein
MGLKKSYLCEMLNFKIIQYDNSLTSTNKQNMICKLQVHFKSVK